MLFLYNPKSSTKEQVVFQISRYLKEQGSPQEVYISTPKRSSSQNRLFHSNCEILADTGYTVAQMKAILKHGITDTGKLKMVDYIIVKGKPVPVYVSTADLDKKEFGILMEYVYDIGNVLGLTMNRPGESLED